MRLKETENRHEVGVKMSQRYVTRVDTDSSIKARMPKIPPFYERHDEMDSYLFERFAMVQNWDKKHG